MGRFSIRTTEYVVETYYNKEKLTPDVVNTSYRSFGISSVSRTINQTYLIFTFSRIKSLPEEPKFFNLSNPFYILVAFGATDSLGSPTFHRNNSWSSKDLISFDKQSLTSPYIPTGQYEYKEFKLKWSKLTTAVNFEFSATVSDSNNVWSAFGFSTDKQMGNDDVTVCKISNGVGSVQHYYNTAHETPTYLLKDDPYVGFSNMQASYQNGTLFCSFTRLIRNSNVPNFSDLNNTFYLLTAFGRLDSSYGLAKHLKAYSSQEKIDFLSTNSYSLPVYDDKVAKSKAHGCLMVIAWIFFASTGILFSRYYKFLFPESKICGLQFWFVLHRPLMIIATLISIASFIVILSKVDWKWVSTDEPVNYAHSIFGIVSISFSIFQVFVAILRPQKTHPRRFVFNYFHKTVGLSAYLFAVVALFLGVNIEEMYLGRLGWGLMLGWGIWCIVLPLVIEIFKLILGVRKIKTVYERNQDENSEERSPSPSKPVYNKIYQGIKSFFMVVHLGIALAFTVALIVVIAIAEEDRFI